MNLSKICTRVSPCGRPFGFLVGGYTHTHTHTIASSHPIPPTPQTPTPGHNPPPSHLIPSPPHQGTTTRTHPSHPIPSHPTPNKPPPTHTHSLPTHIPTHPPPTHHPPPGHDNSELVDLAVDDARNLLYSLSANSVIQVGQAFLLLPSFLGGEATRFCCCRMSSLLPLRQQRHPGVARLSLLSFFCRLLFFLGGKGTRFCLLLSPSSFG